MLYDWLWDFTSSFKFDIYISPGTSTEILFLLTMGFLSSLGLMQRTKKGWQTLSVLMSSSSERLNWLLRVGERFLVSIPWKHTNPLIQFTHKQEKLTGEDRCCATHFTTAHQHKSTTNTHTTYNTKTPDHLSLFSSFIPAFVKYHSFILPLIVFLVDLHPLLVFVSFLAVIPYT